MKSTMQEVLAKIAVELFDPEFNFIKDFQEYCGQVSSSGQIANYQLVMYNVHC